jgi:hypothetical protein
VLAVVGVRCLQTLREWKVQPEVVADDAHGDVDRLQPSAAQACDNLIVLGATGNDNAEVFGYAMNPGDLPGDRGIDFIVCW